MCLRRLPTRIELGKILGGEEGWLASKTGLESMRSIRLQNVKIYFSDIPSSSTCPPIFQRQKGMLGLMQQAKHQSNRRRCKLIHGGTSTDCNTSPLCFVRWPYEMLLLGMQGEDVHVCLGFVIQICCSHCNL